MAERRHWHGVCLMMTMRIRLARLFTIKTRAEAFLITYAIAVGSIERGVTYLGQYPGTSGWLLAIACLGVPFVAGAKLIDSVKPVAMVPARIAQSQRRRGERLVSRNRPTRGRLGRGSALRSSRRTD